MYASLCVMSCAECLKPKIGKAHPYFPEEYIYTVGYCLIKYDIKNLIYIKDDYICHCIKSKALITITIIVYIDTVLSPECIDSLNQYYIKILSKSIFILISVEYFQQLVSDK